MIILSSIYIKNFRIDAASDTLVAKNDQDFLYYNSYSNLFTSENFLVLAIKNNNEIDNKFVEKFDFLSNEILKLKNVKRVFSFIELRFIEHGIEFVDDQMPKMVVDISILDSRIEKTSTFLVMFSVYNYSISEEDYYRSMADTLITRKLMTSKVYSQELIGQTSSNKIHKDVEKSINEILSTYLDHWYRDNPLKQF